MGKNKATSQIIDSFLVTVGATTTLSLTIIAPNAIKALEKPLSKLLDAKRSDTKRLAQYMKDQKLLTIAPLEDGSFSIKLTEKGRERSRRAYFDRLEIPAGKWDGKWRIFMFDIPEKHKQLRDFVSYHVKRVGFRQLQRSVFVFPYPIEDFVVILKEIHPELKQYTAMLEADNIDKHNDLVKLFKNIL